MAITAAFINAADAAQMRSVTGGIGPLALLEVSGRPKFRDKWQTGVHPVPYSIDADNGMREWAVGNYNADTDTLERPDVVLSWAPGVGFASTKVSLPTTGVRVGFAVTVGMYNAIQSDLQELAADVLAFVASLEDKADATHGHGIADVAGLQAALDALAGGETGGVTPGIRGDINVVDADQWRIVDGAVDTAAMGGDVTTPGKALLTAADVAAQRTVLGLGSAAQQAASAFAASSHSHDASALASGTVPTARMPALTGDVTMAPGTTETAIPLASVGTSKLGGDITTIAKAFLQAADAAAQRTAMGLGSAATQASSAFAASSHAHSAADIASGTIAAARMPAHTGDVTSSAGSVALTIASGAVTTGKLADGAATTAKIADDAITNAKLAHMPTATVKANIAGGTTEPADVPIDDFLAAGGVTEDGEATAADVNAGTDDALAITPAALSKSKFGERSLIVELYPPTVNVAVANLVNNVALPSSVAGMDLVSAFMYTDPANMGSGGSPTTVQVERRRAGANVNVFSTAITMDPGDEDSSTAATAAVINPANADVQLHDKYRFNVTDVPTTPPKGLWVLCTFRLPAA